MLDNVDGDLNRVQMEMQTGQVRNPHEGKKLTIGAMQVVFKTTAAETGGRFALIEITVPPYYSEIELHQHHQTFEAIYLAQGMLAVTLGDETMVVRQGSTILVPPMQQHRFWNPTAAPATFVLYFAPAGAEQFFEALAASELVDHPRLPGDLAEIWALGMAFDHYPTE